MKDSRGAPFEPARRASSQKMRNGAQESVYDALLSPCFENATDELSPNRQVAITGRSEPVELNTSSPNVTLIGVASFDCARNENCARGSDAPAENKASVMRRDFVRN